MCWISLMVTGFIGHSYIVLTVTVFNAVITEFPVKPLFKYLILVVKSRFIYQTGHRIGPAIPILT